MQINIRTCVFCVVIVLFESAIVAHWHIPLWIGMLTYGLSGLTISLLSGPIIEWSKESGKPEESN